MQIIATDGEPGFPGKVPWARYPVAPTLTGFSTVDVKVEAAESGLAYDLVATVEPDGTGKLVVTKLTAAQVDGGPPIQRGELAKISVEHFIRFVAAETVLCQEGNRINLFPGPPEDFWERVAANGFSDADLHDLARAYRWVRLQEGKPTALIAAELGLSTATVRRWVAKAVEAGYLTQAERTK